MSKPMVVHTVTFPGGTDLSRYNLSDCVIKREQRTKYSAGTIPETILDKCNGFELYIEPNDPATTINNQRYYSVRNHFM